MALGGFMVKTARLIFCTERLVPMLKRLWNYETNSLWVWRPLRAFALLLIGGFLI